MFCFLATFLSVPQNYVLLPFPLFTLDHLSFFTFILVPQCSLIFPFLYLVPSSDHLLSFNQSPGFPFLLSFSSRLFLLVIRFVQSPLCPFCRFVSSPSPPPPPSSGSQAERSVSLTFLKIMSSPLSIFWLLYSEKRNIFTFFSVYFEALVYWITLLLLFCAMTISSRWKKYKQFLFSSSETDDLRVFCLLP